MISKEKWTWEITQPDTDREAEDRETQNPCPGCNENTLAPTLGVSACAFQELRRCVVPCGMSRDESYMVRGAMSRVVFDAHTVEPTP